MTIKFSEVDFAGDVKAFISSSSDVTFETLSHKSFIMNSDNSDLLLVEKTIASPIKIIGVQKVDENFIEQNL